MKHLLLILLAITVLASCKKEDIKPDRIKHQIVVHYPGNNEIIDIVSEIEYTTPGPVQGCISFTQIDGFHRNQTYYSTICAPYTINY